MSWRWPVQPCSTQRLTEKWKLGLPLMAGSVWGELILGPSANCNSGMWGNELLRFSNEFWKPTFKKNLARKVIKTWKHTQSHILLYFSCLSSVFIKNLKFSDRPAEAGSIHCLTRSDRDSVALEMDAFNHVLDFDRDGDGRRLELVPNRLVKSCFISDKDAEVEILHCLVVHFLERQSQRYCRGSGV